MSGPKSTNDQGLSTLPSTFKGNTFKRKAQPPVDRKDTELGSALGGDHPERGSMTRGQSIVSDRGRDPGLMGGAWSHLSSPGPRDETSPRSFSLGATSGLVAAGAWAARLEVANLLESGCPPEQLLALIRRGEESDVPLNLDWDAKETRGHSDRDADLRSNASLAERTASERSRSPRHPSKGASAVDSTREFGDLFEGENMEDIVAEQAAILSEIAKSKNDPPWMTAGPSEVGGANASSKGTRGNTVLQMAATEPTFRKKLAPPPEGLKAAAKEGPKRIYEPEMDSEELPSFRGKATPPPPGVVPEPTKRPGQRPAQHPGGGSAFHSLEARERDDLQRFVKLAIEIDEGLEVVGITMDLEKYVRVQKGIDKEKFMLHASPNRASTGLRYVRVMKGIVEWIESFNPVPKDDKLPPLERLRLVEYIELLVQKGVGYNTPQTLLFAIDYFSKAFGFDPTGKEWNRAKRLAVKYKKSKPGLASRAPLFGKATLAALEMIVLDDVSSVPQRIAAGKLRLCCQASIRYDDLVHTPLKSLEWVRRRGGTKVVGVRAKTTQGKNKARP